MKLDALPPPFGYYRILTGTDDLHFGYWPDGQAALQFSEAQAALSCLLLACFPPPPARVLDVGCGLGAMAGLLHEKGYQVVALAPAAELIQYAAEHHPGPEFLACGFLDHHPRLLPPARYDVVLFQESIQYFPDLAAVFSRVGELLEPGNGRLVFCDEVSYDPETRKASPVHEAGQIKQQLDLSGFHLTQHLRIGDNVLPTCAFAVRRFQEERQNLLDCFGQEAADSIDHFLQGWHQQQRWYELGQFGYELWAATPTRTGLGPIAANREERPSPSPWQVEWARREDEADLLALFVRAFGHAMAPDQWRWKYAAAEQWGALVRKNGQVVAFYGGMPRPIRFFGKEDTAVQIGDVMVDPAQGRVLTRHGPFFKAASAYLERFIGPHKEYCLGFGFPSKRVNRLAEHLGLYASVGEVQEASWGPRRPWPHIFVTVRPLAAMQLELVAPLWQQMAAECTDFILPVRDGAYIRHRYLQHPTTAYLVLLVRRRFSGRPYGLLVLRDHGDGGVELVDLVGPLAHLPRLVVIARQVTGGLGRQKLFAWLTEPVAKALAASELQVAATDVSIPTSIWQIPSAVERIRDRWWLMGGDADFR